MIPVLITALVALLAVDAWLASALFDATFHEGDTCKQDGWDYDCNGWPYWVLVALAAGVLLGLIWATWRVWMRLHASFASRFARPS